MAREPFHTFVDLSQPDVKRGLMTMIGRMTDWWEVTLKPRRGTRSQQQLRYYWAVVAESLYHYLKNDCGWNLPHAGAAHDWAKSEFLKVPIVDGDGAVVAEIAGSTGDLDTVGMSEFIERVRMFLDDKGVITPDPDPSWQVKVGAA